MKKTVLIIGGVLIVGAAAAAGYYIWDKNNDYGEPTPPRDLTGVIVPPVDFPLKGKTFVIPETEERIEVILDLSAPSARRDYPMARYDKGDGVTRGSLVALDEFTTDAVNGKRAVPIAVNKGGSGEFFYLALLDEQNGELSHTSSIPLGDRIKIKDVKLDGTQVSVTYLVHDRGQAMVELPKVETTAIIDIETGNVLQAGRNPQTETVIETKRFSGTYDWKETTYADKETVTPTVPDRFGITFNGDRVNILTDCNSGSATYSASSGTSTTFALDAIATTKMFCESSQESEYLAMFPQVTDYEETATGLTLIMGDAGEIVFVKQEAVLEYESTTPGANVSDDPSGSQE